ncbi:hypothetical protein EV213_11425 [Aureibacillus halotolerans]|uniref:Uncharacterized protein n=1 Tax=Aureibacillus halotolerans TaxID=1508390 RepID=A0A4R6TVC5_9BACI|nr:hypothetical protein EV213_11425 [Aureibacillus halotolerans]
MKEKDVDDRINETIEQGRSFMLTRRGKMPTTAY